MSELLSKKEIEIDDVFEVGDFVVTDAGIGKVSEVDDYGTVELYINFISTTYGGQHYRGWYYATDMSKVTNSLKVEKYTKVFENVGQRNTEEEYYSRIKYYLKQLQRKPNILIWEELLESIFPNMWDIQEEAVVIKFPELTLRNDDMETHDIKDLYVTWPINPDATPLGPMSGFRGLLTPTEFFRGYSHSHLRVGLPRGNTNNFCLGSSDYGDLMNNINSGCSSDLWGDVQKALLMLTLYVEWENTGNPYKRMNTVVDASEDIAVEELSERYIEVLYSRILSKMEELKDYSVVEFTYNTKGDKIFKVNPKAFRRFLVPVCRTGYAEYIRIQLPNGELVSPGSNRSYDIGNMNFRLREESHTIIFKGEQIIPEIYIAEEVKKELTGEEVVMDIAMIPVLEKLENRINNYVFNYKKT